jgi:RecA-family ATPase
MNLRAAPKLPPSLLARENRDIGPWLGTAGILAGAGNVGKTWAALDLALRVAAGAAEWLGCRILEPGRVVYVAAEDPAEILAGRLSVLAQRLTDDEKDRAETRFRLVSLAESSPELLRVLRIVREAEPGELKGKAGAVPLRDGVPVPGRRLPSVAETIVESSELLKIMREDLRQARQAGDPVRLVVLDPLARLGGSDAETDNAVAARLMRELGGLAIDAGGAVLVVHHTTKAARASGTADGTGIRGASALVDGARWAAELTAGDEDASPPAVTLSISKASYGRRGRPVSLRSEDGPLRIETAGEQQQRNAAAEEEQRKREAKRSAKKAAPVPPPGKGKQGGMFG